MAAPLRTPCWLLPRQGHLRISQQPRAVETPVPISRRREWKLVGVRGLAQRGGAESPTRTCMSDSGAVCLGQAHQLQVRESGPEATSPVAAPPPPGLLLVGKSAPI